jgi:hypothetical protein
LNASARIATLLTFLLLLPETAAADGEDFTPLGVGILLSLLAFGDVMPSGETAACRAARGRIGILEGPRQLDILAAAVAGKEPPAEPAAAGAAAVPGLQAVVRYSAAEHDVNVSGSVSALRVLGFALEGGSVRGLGFALVKQLSVTQLLYTLSKPCCGDRVGMGNTCDHHAICIGFRWFCMAHDNSAVHASLQTSMVVPLNSQAAQYRLHCTSPAMRST